MDPSSEPVAHLLYAAARARRVSQVRIAELSGLTRSWANEVLTGRRPGSLLVLCRIAQLTGVTGSQLREIGREDVAVLVEAAPTVEQASTAALADELARRVGHGTT